MKRSIAELSSTVLNENSKRHTLHPHRSKLDLMDDTRLTSLPLPPPPPKRTSYSSTSSPRNSISSLEKKGQQTEDVKVNEEDKENKENNDNGNDNDNDEDEYDEYEDESQDPIVLVEDYMNKSALLPHMFRQKSLANFKSRVLVDCYSESTSFIEPHQSALSGEVIYKEVSHSHTLTSLSTPRNSISEDATRYINRKDDKEDLEAIFGTIPGSDLLKYCDLCDKPLYEISSIIHNNNTKESKQSKRNHYEFVCGDCIENYETFINEYYDSEDEEEVNTEKSRNKLLRIFHSIQYKYNLTEETKKNKISTNLIERLHLIQAGNIGK